MHLVFWGTYDTGKPRVRILLRGLRENGVTITECHANLWDGIEDKSQLLRKRDRLRILIKWLWSYPSLIARYLRLPRHDLVVVSYLGHLDVLVLWPFAKLRRVPIVWDAFLSLYDTVVTDRKLLRAGSVAARALHAWEALACRAATAVVLDTRAHAEFFASEFRVPRAKTGAVLVGAEPEVFYPPAEGAAPDTPNFRVLFYGQFIPLHGVETIVGAARILKDEPIDWQLIGDGQEADKIRASLHNNPIARLRWTKWVRYEELIREIHRADVCLGIFGDSDKAARVIPNKVFQVIAASKPLVTRDSPAIRELIDPGVPEVTLVPAMNAQALAAAVKDASQRRNVSASREYREIQFDIQPSSIGHSFLVAISTIGL